MAHNDYPLSVYGAWAGMLKGRKFDSGKCAEEISCGGGSYLYKQCTGMPGHGDRELFCKVHARLHPRAEEQQS